MSLLFFHGKIGSNYGWELDLVSKLRPWSDGITAFNLNVEYDKYMCDHKPSFEIVLVVFNIKIVEFTIYNIWHVEHPQSPYHTQYLAEEKRDKQQR